MAYTRQVKPGFHRTVLNCTHWDLPGRYHNLTWVGSGSFGQVVKAYDRFHGEYVAIKKLTRPFQSDTDAKRICREIRILRHMSHENIVSLLDLFTSGTSLRDFNDLYIVTTFGGYDMHTVMKCIKLDNEKIQFYMYQIMRGLKYIHSAGIAHRDLKPNNIVINENNELRIVDFGLARRVDNIMTGYVATRYYRAPEIMCNWMKYGTAVDIWSAGCIFAELLRGGKPLFPGTDTIDLFNKIIAVLGSPSEETVSRITSSSARTYIKSLPKFPKKDLRDFVGSHRSATIIDFLTQLLQFDPTKRISATKALQHKYLATWSDPDDEPECLKRFNRSHDSLNLEISGWKKLIFDHIKDIKKIKEQSMIAEAACF